MPPQLNQLKFRQPKLVTPKSPFPWDVASAMAEMEKDAFNALIKEPAQAAGMTAPPELPGPATVLSMATAPLQQILGNFKLPGTQSNPGGGGGGNPNQTQIQTRTPAPQPPTPARGIKVRQEGM